MRDMIEAVTRYWNRQPCGSLRPPEWRDIVEPHVREFAQFGRWRGRWVLEIGCGIGRDTAEFVFAGAHVWAVDLSQESIGLAIKRVPSDGYRASANFYCTNAEESLPYIEDGFDLVYSFGVLHHTPHPDRVLWRAFERTKVGGELRIMVYAKWSLKRMLGEQPEAQAGCPLVRWYSVREARRLVEKAGFRVVSIRKRHIFPYRVREYVEGKLVKRWPYRVMPQFLFRALERFLGHHLLVVARRPWQ